MTALVTRCPQCGAAFRVVADQLRLRGGKVRCGVCHAVFDARAQQVAVPASTPDAAGSAAPPSAAVAPPKPVRVSPPVQRVTRPAPDPSATRTAPPHVPPWTQPAQDAPRAPAAGHAPAVGDTPRKPPSAPAWHASPTPPRDAAPMPTPPRDDMPMRASPRLPAARMQEPIVGPGLTRPTPHSGKREPVFSSGDKATDYDRDDETFDEPEFDVAPDADIEVGQDFTEAEDFVATRHETRGAMRRRRPSRLSAMFWRTACVLAGVALVLQALWWWRTPLATYVPVLRPVYENLCAGLGCAAGYVRQPSQLSIESSSMHPEALARADSNAQRMAMAALLRNRAAHPQPWPTIELSLTDFSDTVVVRRLIAPEEYLGPDAPSAFAGHSERAVNVSVTVRGIPVSGYRLALFFP